MKLYTFFYYDCLSDFKSGKRSEFTITASRFSIALKGFTNFVNASSFCYFGFDNSYLVTTKKSVHRRLFSAKDYVLLASLKEPVHV